MDVKLRNIDFLFGENEDEYFLYKTNSTIGFVVIGNDFGNGGEEYLIGNLI